MDEEKQTGVLDALRDAEEEPKSLSQLMRDYGDEDDSPEMAPAGAEAGPAEDTTTLQRLQTLWIEATEDEQEEFFTWLERMKAQENAEQPSDA